MPVEKIAANPYQPRKNFDRDKLESLANSIRRNGILQPVVVRRSGEGYELVMGERRLQAARLGGVPTVPVVVKEVTEVDSLRLALVENLQREDLNPIEVAQAYEKLVESFGLSLAELAEFVGKDRSTVANTLRLLTLPEKIKEMLIEGKLSEGHARALLSLKEEKEQLALSRRVVDKGLSVRETERLVALRSRPERKPRKQREKPAHIVFLENAFSRHLGTRVNIEEKKGGKGRITIEFYSYEEFERLAELMHIPIPR